MTSPPNDTYAGATPLGPYATGILPWTTIDCGLEDPAEWAGWGGYTAYFTFTPTVGGPIDLIMDADADDTGALPNTALAVWAGLTSVPLYPANDPPLSYTYVATPGVDPPASAHFVATAGVTYTIQVDTEPPVMGGLQFSVPGLPPAPAGSDQHPPLAVCGQPQVWTSTPDGTGSDRIYLSQLGEVTALRYSSAFPGGAKALSCSLAIDPLSNHRALAPGRDCGVTVGAVDVWQGTLNGAPLADDGTRQVTADGDSATLTRYVALGLAAHNALYANEIIDAARQSGRGLRFLRDNLDYVAGSQARDAAFTIDEALTQAAAGSNKRWMVDEDRTIRFYPYTGTGDLLHLRSRHDPGRTLDGHVTGLVIAFIDSLTGLYRVEHVDASASESGKTVFPNFYLPDLSGYSARNFTLYLQGSVLTAYVLHAPATADTMHLTPTATLTLAETSGVYTRWTGPAPGGLAVGDTGATATYTLGGGASLGSGTQDFTVQSGSGSLGPVGNFQEREQVVDLTSQGAFTLAEALTQGAAALAKTKVQPHYNGPFTAAPGDLRNAGGVPVDLATVRAGAQLLALVTDPTRSLDLQADAPLVSIGEVEYDVETLTLTLTPAESPVIEDPVRTIDPLTGLAR